VLFECGAQTTPCFGRLLLERPNVAFEPGERTQRRGSDDGRGAAARREHGNFTDEVAGPYLTQRGPPAEISADPDSMTKSA